MDKEKIGFGNYDYNLNYVKEYFRFGINADIVIRELVSKDSARLFVVFLDGMVNNIQVNDYIVRPIMSSMCADIDNILDIIQFGNCKVENDLDKACNQVLQGDTVVFKENVFEAAVCETKGFDRRSVSRPETENAVKGSHEGFTESIRSNISLIRRIVKTGSFVSEMVTVGQISGEKCAIVYLDNITNSALVNEVRRRLNNIKGDFYSGSGMIEQMIEDSRFSLFPSILTTERPERAAQYLSSGRVLIVCDNTPFVMVIPITVSELFDSPEGNQQRWQNGTFTKLVRIFAFLCSTVLSGLYISVLNFHRELLPSQLLAVISESRAEIPFTALAELIVMELFFELVREAGIRIPNAIGGAVGVVSGLILGQAAVEAKIVSPVTLIIVAIAGIANAALPDYDMSFGIRIIKFGLIILGGSFGLAGFSIGLILMTLMLTTQRSFGIDMTQPSSFKSASSGILIQTPIWLQEMRSKYLNSKQGRQQPKYSRQWDREGEDN